MPGKRYPYATEVLGTKKMGIKSKIKKKIKKKLKPKRLIRYFAYLFTGCVLIY